MNPRCCQRYLRPGVLIVIVALLAPGICLRADTPSPAYGPVFAEQRVLSDAAYSSTQAVDPRLWETDGTVRAMARSGNTLYIGGEFNSVSLRTHEGVPLRLSDGTVAPTFPKLGDWRFAVVRAVVPDGEGGWYIGGTFSSVGDLPRSNLAHILADGSVAAWDPGGTDYDVLALALSGHTLFVGGYFREIGGQARNGLAAVDSRTGAVMPWDAQLNSGVEALVVKGHSLYVGGIFTMIGGQVRHHIAELDTRTGLATAWDPDANFGVMSLALRERTVYVGGYFTTIGGQPRSKIAAVDVETGLATDWNPSAISHEPWNPQYQTSPWVQALAVSESTLFAGGHFDSIGGQPRAAVAELDLATGAATPWNANLRFGYFYPFPAVGALALSGSKVFVGGTFSNSGGPTLENFAALDVATGAPIGWSVGMELSVTALAVGGENLYVGGAFRTVIQRRHGLAALDVTTGAAKVWDPRMSGRRVNALAVSGNSVIVGGDFLVIGGQTRYNLAVLDTVTGTASPYFFPNPNGEVRSIAATPTGFYVGGDFTSLGGQVRNHLAGVLSSGYVTYWNPNADGPVDALVASGQTFYAGGSFTKIAAQPRGHLAAIDLLGVATDWDPSADGRVGVLLVRDGIVYAGGEFTEIGGRPRAFIAAVDSVSGAATDWNPGTDAVVDALALNSGVLYAGGSFANMGGQPRRSIAAVDPVTGGVFGWNPIVNGRVMALSADDVLVFAGGEFDTLDGQSHRGIAAIGAASSSDVVVSAVGALRGSSLLLGQNVPNPARSSTRIRFTLPAAQRVSLEVFDLLGRRVAIVLDRTLQASGAHEVPIPTDGWRAGVYLYRLQAGDLVLCRKMLVVR